MYWYINDHIGTPQELVDAQGNIAWSGVSRRKLTLPGFLLFSSRSFH
ncbi:TPA: RHS domain-containing protein [Klebsiella aerogenes]|nr:RHS domain-containing protein [Klebsiella aerogenes]